MEVLIIEDEAPASRRLSGFIKELYPDFKIVDIIESVDASVKWFNCHLAPDIIFMDIQLADGLSFEIFEKAHISSPVIFTTAYDEYALKAFKVNSIDYLLKPINKEELEQSIRKYKDLRSRFSQNGQNEESLQNLIKSLRENKKEYKNRFLVKLGDRLIPLKEEDIAYFRAEDKIVLLHTTDNKKFAIDTTLDTLIVQLDPSKFFRLNRQLIAHSQAIKSIHTYFNGKLKIYLQPDVSEEVTVSREKSMEFKQWLGN